VELGLLIILILLIQLFPFLIFNLILSKNILQNNTFIYFFKKIFKIIFILFKNNLSIVKLNYNFIIDVIVKYCYLNLLKMKQLYTNLQQPIARNCVFFTRTTQRFLINKNFVCASIFCNWINILACFFIF